MIGVNRGAEPKSFTTMRHRKLAAARLAHSADPGLPGFVFDGHKVARPFLYAAQHGKCAYCEAPTGEEEQPVEHFRPKDGAQRDPDDPASTDPTRYWWLAWSWENLLFACTTCNGRSHKGNHFPLAGGAPLQILSFDLTAEQAGLIDPATEDPLLHIRWIPLDRTPTPSKWRWFPAHRTERGRLTVRIFKLRQLEDLASKWVSSQILEDLDCLRAQIPTDLPAAEAAWGRLTRRLFAPTVGWHALSWCALEELFPADRRPAGWTLARPGKPGSPIAAQDLPPPPAGVSQQDWWTRLAAGEAP